MGSIVKTQTQYPKDWVGKFLICTEYGTHAAEPCWRPQDFGHPYDNREDADKCLEQLKMPNRHMVVEIGEKRDWPSILSYPSDEKPKVGIGVVVKKDDKIALGKRKGSHGEGEWSLPGGHLEFFETFDKCCRREVFEETSLRIKNIRPMIFTNDTFFNEHPQLHYITLFFCADWDSGDLVLMEPEKCEGWDWFSTVELPKPLFTPLENLLRQYW